MSDVAPAASVVEPAAEASTEEALLDAFADSDAPLDAEIPTARAPESETEPEPEPEIEEQAPPVPAKAERKLPPRVRGYDPTRTATIIKEGRKYLFSSDDLEHAPSIGPKTAEKFAAVGINTVGDFLEHNPDDMAELLDDGQADAETLADWQDQAQLVIDVPGLRGTHAQLLVGAGYRTAQAVAEADPVELSANVLKFVSTSEGKRVLRAGMPPDIEKIKGWVEVARHAVAA
jgi:predicted flap endonuclease-1-like 5' DNA nuclease